MDDEGEEGVEGGAVAGNPLGRRLRRVTDHSVLSNDSEVSEVSNDELGSSQGMSLSALLALEEEKERRRLQTEVYNEFRITQEHGPAVATLRAGAVFGSLTPSRIDEGLNSDVAVQAMT